MVENTEEVRYAIVHSPEGWTIHNGDRVEGSYETQRGAFDEVVYAAINALLAGHSLVITVDSESRG